MNFYKHHLGDYASHTAHLTWDEDCAYTRLLRLYYQTEHPLGYSALIKIGGVGGVVLSEHPLSVLSDIYRVIKAEKSHQKVAVKAILSEFFTIESDGYHNKRADEEIARYQAQASTNRRIARERFVDGSLEDRSPNQTPDTRHQETPIAPKGADDPPGFAAFWSSWPQSVRKVDRKKCAEKWRRKGCEALAETIAQHVEAMKATKQWREGFEPAPMTYLNGERWADGADQGEFAPEGFL
jgi:uncharacterized protein YdaU (DUF1376 family)